MRELRLGDLDCLQEPPCLAHGFFVLTSGIAVVNHATPGLDVGRLSLNDHGPKRDAGVHIAGEIDVADRPAIRPRFCGSTSSMICIARTLGPRDRTGGQARTQGVKGRLAGPKPAGHIEVMCITCEYRSTFITSVRRTVSIIGDAAHVVAAQVDQHDVLGPLLGIGQELFGQRPVFGFVGPAARVPASGRIVTIPSSTRTKISGELPINAKSP